VPLERNPLFVGREGELQQIAADLAPERATVVVCGTGGLGKTQLAVEYAYRAAGAYPGGVFWVPMEQAAGVAAQVAAFAAPDRLALPGFDPQAQAQNTALVQRAWEAPIARLLIFDNLEEQDAVALLREWRPRVGGCRVLITSRSAHWPARLGVRPLYLGTLPRPDSLRLVLTPRAEGQGRAGGALLADPATARDADALCAWLGDLPLALALAAAYLEAYPSVTLDRYLAELQDNQLEHRSLNLPQEQDIVFGHHAGLRVTFLYSYERLDEADPADALALTLLHRAAWCAPGVPIPRPLLLRLTGLSPEDANCETAADGALRRLASLGLIEWEREADGGARLHRLLAAYARSRAPDSDADERAVEAALTRELRAINDAGYPLAGAPYLAHGRAAAARAQGREEIAAARLLNELGRLLHAQGDYAAARPLFDRALAIDEAVRGPDDPSTAASVAWLAYLYKTQGDYAAARPLYERALAITERALGPTHPDTATSLNNLAELLRAQGDTAAARPLHERALAITEQALGPTHLATAIRLNNLAGLLRDQGDTAAARPLFERALGITEQALGPAHPDTATSLWWLAVLHQDAGELAAARPLFERAVAICERALGPDHPRTRTVRANLDILLADMAAGGPTSEQ
jgi:tetratricopeptide (TPR) repeat protein